MALANWVQNDVVTSAGVLRVSTAPETPHALKPVVLAIHGTFGPEQDIISLGETLGILGSLSLVALPSGADPLLTAGGLAAVSRAVSNLIETTFAGRPVVLLGISIGAIIGLGVRATNLTRVVAVEPLPTMTDGRPAELTHRHANVRGVVAHPRLAQVGQVG